MSEHNELIDVRLDRTGFDLFMGNDQPLEHRMILFSNCAGSVYKDAREHFDLIKDCRSAFRALEHQLNLAQREADKLYFEYFDNLRVCKREFCFVDVLELFDDLKLRMPMFEDEPRYQEYFFRQFDLHPYLIQAWRDGEIDEETLDELIDGSCTGETEFGIAGGLEMLHLDYPLGADDIRPPYGEPFLYILIGKDKPLYVGQTIFVSARMKSHVHEAKKGGIDRLIAIRLRDKDDLSRQEQRLIQKLNPPMNKTFVNKRSES